MKVSKSNSQPTTQRQATKAASAETVQPQVQQPAAPAQQVAQFGLTHEDIKVLRGAFSKDRLGVKVQSVNKDRTRAMLVLYLQHTDVQDRLEEVDPSWSIEVLSEWREGDTTYVRCRMTIKGVSRENVGEGGDPKAAYSDSLKRCAMLFGVGRYLYDSPTVWTEYNESRDRYKQWSVDDYEASARGFTVEKPAPAAPAGLTTSAAAPAAERPAKRAAVSPRNAAPAAAPAASSGGASGSRPREELNRVLMNLYRPYLSQYPQTQFSELLQSRYQVSETRLMTVEQLEDLVHYMESRLASVA